MDDRADLEEEIDEALEDLPEAEKRADPLRHAKIRRVVGDRTFMGKVEDIEVGQISRERLYRIRYEDGDLEHITEAEVREMQLDGVEETEAAFRRRHKQTAICRHFNGSARSCKFGDSCHFLHLQHSGQRSATTTTTASASSNDRGFPAGVTHKQACKNWTGVTGSCRYGDLCQFSHSNCNNEQPGPNSAARQDRTSVQRPCKNWTGTLGSCRFGSQCLFLHDRGDGRRTSAMDELESHKIPACCVCLEEPRQRKVSYGLLEGCDHAVCMPCVMAWRKNHDVSREARLGCPVCRTLSYIVVPWPEAASGDEKLAIVSQQKERWRVTPCKWSSAGKPCPAGKHCMFDHSNAPQVVQQSRRRRSRDPFGDIDEDILMLSALMRPLIGGGGNAWGLDDSSSEGEEDDEIEEAIQFARFMRNLR
eukprot:TRINITY_DN5265_c0_g5_i1.p1 TRINITY_DN5265_c0_g5~~TRINITY_DN5265_c0_g5_i1.p1  ORF type:complete len:420 (+),score=76.92 TRINITY_DN5265_c0_g5_i1:160-1419(+)